MIPAAFHFLRPEWLLALFPAAAILALAVRRMGRAGSADWAKLIDAHLLRHLSVAGAAQRGSKGWLAALAVALVACVLAMAGPTWEKRPTPVYGGAEPRVIVLSLAQSMNGTDLVPSRLARAGHKLRDMLDHVKGSDVALIIYADRPFIAAPLTADVEVIHQMLPDLSTSLMPVLGNRLDLAINEAQGLLARAGAAKGRIVVIADDAGQDPAASLTAAQAVKSAGYQLAILGVGTAKGADLQTADGRAITTQDGQAMTARLDVAGLTALAQAGGGAFSEITPDGSDIAALLPATTSDRTALGKASDMMTDSWSDMGYILLILPILLAPFAFRRGLLFALPLMFFSFGLSPNTARAGSIFDLLQTPDQQGQSAFDSGDFAGAATHFTNPTHKAAALYRAEEFDAAAQVYASLPAQTSAKTESYNLANALAKSGKFEDALAGYDEVLAKAPNDVDARFNRDLVAKLLKQQKQDQSQAQDNKDQSDQTDAAQQSQQPQDGGGKPDGQDADQAPQPADASDAKSTETGQSKPAPSAQQNAGQPTGDDSEPSASDRPGADAQQPLAGEKAAAQQEGAEPAEPQATAQDDKTPAGQNGDLKSMMDKVLDANGNQTAKEAGTAGQTAGPALEQAAEQQLRAVPDDPSGLLRARIRQYYARLSAAGQ